MNIFNLFGKLTLDTGEYTQGIEQAKQSNTDLTNHTQKNGLKTVAVWAAIAAAIIKVANSVKKLVTDSTAYVDNIKNMAQIYGYTTKEIQEMQSVAEQSGKSLERVLRATKSSGETFYEYLGLTKEQYDQMVQQAYEFNTIMGDEALDRVDALGDRITYLKSEFKAMVTAMLSGDENSEQAVQSFIDNILAIVQDYAPVISKFITKLVTMLVRSVIKILPDLVAEIMDAVADVLANVNWLELAWEIVKGLAKAIIELIKGIGKTFVGLIKGIFSGKDTDEGDFMAGDYSDYVDGASDFEVTENSSQKIDISLSVAGDGTAVGENNAQIVGSALADTIDNMLGRKLNG